jgi:hypothetical protein
MMAMELQKPTSHNRERWMVGTLGATDPTGTTSWVVARDVMTLYDTLLLRRRDVAAATGDKPANQ